MQLRLQIPRFTALTRNDKKRVILSAPIRRRRTGSRRILALFAFLILLVAAPGAYLLLHHPRPAEAAWFDTNWGFRERIPLTNTSGSDQTNFQVQVTINTSALVTAGKLLSTCNDLRMTNISGKLLPYWIEPGTCNTTSTLVWVKADTIPNGGGDIYAYYGNPSANNPNYKTTDVFIRDLTGVTAVWPLQDTTATQSYAAVNNPTQAMGRNTIPDGTNLQSANWAKGTGWTISGGVATHAAGTNSNMFQGTVGLTIGKAYQVTYTVSNYVAGTVKAGPGSGSISNATGRTANGTYTEILICTTDTSFYVNGDVNFNGGVSNIILTQVNIPPSGGTATQLLVDGNMETAGTAAWIVGNSATLAKSTSFKHAGTQSLSVARGAVNNPYAKQTVLTVGQAYRLYGYALSDGTATPQVFTNSTGTTLWTGNTTQNTTNGAWQPFDFIFVATATDLNLGSNASSGTATVYFDDVTVSLDTNMRTDSILSTLDGDMEQIGTSYWTAQAGITLSKVTASPHSGAQDMRLTAAGGGFGGGNGASQNVLAAGKSYRFQGWYRTDGTASGRLSTQTVGVPLGNPISWTFFDQVFTGATATSNVQLYVQGLGGGSGGWVEFDDLTVTEIDPLVGSNGTNGANVTVGAAAGGHLTNAYSFNGTNNYVNIYSSDLNSAFNPNEGTLVAWAKVSGAGVWTDGTARIVTILYSGGNNFLQIYKRTNNTLTGFFMSGGTSKSVDISTSTTGWFQLAMTWSKSSDQVKVYFNGTPGTTQTGLGTWSGNLLSTQTIIGADDTSGSFPWSGLINDVHLYNRALSAAEISDLYGTGTVDRQAYTTDNYSGHELLRQYATTVSVGSLQTEEVGAAPVAYWKFDDGTGTTAKDSSSNANNGTLGGTTFPTWQTEDQCVSGKCLYFDGSTSKVTGSKVAAVQSVAFWVRPNTIATQGLLNLDGGTHKISTNGSGVLTATGFTSPTYYVNGVATTTPTLTQNQWNYVEITTGTSFNTTASFTLGTDGTNFQKGYFDEFKLYSYARSAAQIQADYLVGAARAGSSSVVGAQKPFLSNGLVGYWKMDETSWNGTAGEVKDSSGNGNNGTAVGGGGYNNGVSTGGNTSTTLNNTGAGWPVNYFITDTITISSGTGAGQTRAVASNTATTITISTPWATIPDTTSHYTFATTPGTGKFGNGAVLNGGNDYIGVGNTSTFAWLHGASNPTNFQFTISTWVKFAGAAKNYDAILATTQYAGSSIGVMLDRNVNSAIEAYIFNNGSPSVVSLYTANNVYPTDGNWHLVTWTHNQSLSANNSTLFVDGKLVGTATKANVVPSSANSSNNLSFGATNGGTQFLMNGSLDETRIYNRALSADEVRQLYTYAPGPVGYWKLDEATPGTSNDSSGNAYSGTDTGTTVVVGKYGKARKFNGTSDKITVSSTIPVANTFEFWVNPTSNTTTIAALTSGAYVSASSGTLSATGFTSPTIYVNGIAGGTLTAGVWQHVAVTTATAISANAVTFGFGNATYFSGRLDDMRIYNYARTPQQIIEDMRGTGNLTSGMDSSVGGSASSTQPAVPVGFWRFDEGFGTTANNVGNGGSALNGTLTNMSSPATSTSGWQTPQSGNCKINGCLAFDHVNDYVNVPDSSAVQFGTNDFSVSAWVYSTLAYPLGTQGTFVSKGYATGFEYGLYQGALISYIAGTRYFGTIPLSTNTWYNVVMVRKSGTAYYYVNGVLDGTMAASGDVSAAGTVINIGNRPGAGNTYFSGLIDEPKIFNFALTPDQVRQEYNGGAAFNNNVGAASEASTLSDTAGNPPVGYWNFEEGTGNTVNDVSGNNNTGTWSGTGSHWTTGKIGSAGNFTSATQVTGTIASPPSNNFTLEAWAYPTSDGVVTYIGNTGIANGYGFERNGGTWQIRLGSVGFYNSGVSAPLNAWTHIAMTRESGNWYLYINGVKTGVLGSGNPNSPSGLFLIGNNSFSPLTNGKIDEVKFYNYVRTQAQIAYDYNRGLPVGWWKMDECQGTVIHDSSGNGNNGTLTVGASGTQTAAGTCNDGNAAHAWANGATGKFNSSLNFDGTDDYVISSTATNLPTGQGARTFSAWIKPTNVNPGGAIMSLNMSGSGQSFILLTQLVAGNTYLFSDDLNSNNNVTITGSQIAKVGVWNHLVFTFDGGTTWKYYLNGNLVTNGTFGTTINTATNNLTIGERNDTGNVGARFPGQIDDVRIYNYALSATQVRQLYNGGAGVSYGPAAGTP